MQKKILLYATLLLIVGVFLFYSLLHKGHYETKLPIDFIPYTNQPRTEVVIEGKKYPLMIDLGSSSRLTLRTEILNNIQKSFLRTTKRFDIKGNEYVLPVYLLRNLNIKNMALKNIEAIDEGNDFLAKGAVLYDASGISKDEAAQDKPGRIGRKLFTDVRANLFLDFHRSLVFVCCHLTDRKKDGYLMTKFVWVPFELDEATGIVVRIDTDLGVKKFLLDTGSTKSALKSTVAQGVNCEEWRPGFYSYHSSKFLFGEKDFGGIDLLLVEMGSVLESIDGIIGMDFLKNHTAYIDFQNKRLYLGKSEECFSSSSNIHK